MNNLWFAFGLTMFAGLSTGIGSLLALLAKKNNTKFLSVSLGFSAGVMIYVSLVEIFREATDTLSAAAGLKNGSWLAVAGFFSGILVIAVIDKIIPNETNPHEVRKADIDENKKESSAKQGLYRVGLFTAISIAIHNFPEGLATFISALQEPAVAIPIAAAIAIHNIPEGIAVSVPIYYATGDRKKAFVYSFLSGLAEPLGAVIGYLILLPVMNDTIFGFILAAVAGIMVFISIDELLPAAREYGEHHLSVYGLVGGMAVMAVSLLLFI